MSKLMTSAESAVVSDAILSGTIGVGDTVECLAGLFTVGSVRRGSGGDIEVVMLAERRVDEVVVAFRVGGDALDG